jgi:hypothetical protein
VFVVFLLIFQGAFGADKNAPKTPLKSDFLTLIKVFRHADEMSREMWWAIAADRKQSPMSAFGKLSRALQKDLGVKLSRVPTYSCDKYELKKKAETRPFEVEVSETCIIRNPKLIATFNVEKENKVSVTFVPENMADVMGLQASVVNKKTHCEISFKDNGAITHLLCRDWTQDKNDKELVVLDHFEYAEDKKNIMKIIGYIMAGMNPVKKLEMKVPMQGPIVVRETEIPQPKAPTPTPSPAKQRVHVPPPQVTPVPPPTGDTAAQPISEPGAQPSGEPTPQPEGSPGPQQSLQPTLPEPDMIPADNPPAGGVQAPPQKNDGFIR